MLKQLGRSFVSLMMVNPTVTTASFAFLLGFAVISSNALVAQPGQHPEPIWSTRDGLTTNSLVQKPTPRKQSQTIATPVKKDTKRNVVSIPVPKPKPSEGKIELVSQKPSRQMVADLQAELFRLKYYKGDMDGLYGSGTRNAILEFQKNQKVFPDGLVTYEILKAAVKIKGGTLPETRTVIAKPVEPKKSSETKNSFDGTHNPEVVKLIQIGLVNYGVQEISIDGVFGNQTANAIREFQKQFDLDIDGVPSKKFLRHLKNMGAFENG